MVPCVWYKISSIIRVDENLPVIRAEGPGEGSKGLANVDICSLLSAIWLRQLKNRLHVLIVGGVEMDLAKKLLGKSEN